MTIATNYHFSTTAMPAKETQSGLGSSIEDYHVGLITIATLILLANAFAIQTYKRHEKIHRKCSNVLLLSLAFSDLILGVIYMPVLIFCENQWHKYGPENPAFIYVCRVNHLLGGFSGFSTIFHIIALTLEKYFAVLHPFQRLSISTRGTYRKLLVVIWSFSSAFALVPLFWIFDDPGSPEWMEKFHIYGVVQAVVYLGLGSLVLMYSYIRMFFQIRAKLSAHTQTGRVQTKARNDRKTVLIFLSFFMIFVIGWCPWFFFTLNYKNAELVSLQVKDFLVSLRYVGAVLNPLIYAFIKNDYKQAVQFDFRALCSRCPGAISFQKLVQTNALNRSSNNNNTRRGTLSTGLADVKLVKIESNRDLPNMCNAASVVSEIQVTSQAEDTDL